MASLKRKPVPVASVVEDAQTSPRVLGRLKEIFIAFSILTIPMFILSTVLLSIIYRNQVSHGTAVSERLSSRDISDDAGVIYVNVSATPLATISSWSSTLAPTLVGFAVGLVSFPVARRIYSASERNDTAQLPTPFQLSLMFRMTGGGGLGAFYQWLKYYFGWKHERKPQVTAMKITTITLFLGLLLSILVLITDTWLHFTTKSVNYTVVSPIRTPVNASFELNTRCANPTGNGTSVLADGVCTIRSANPDNYLWYGEATLAVMNNVSTTTMIQTITTDSGTYAYPANLPASVASIDITANTWAVQTQCQFVADECMDFNKFHGISTPFKCPFAFQGDLSATPWTAAYFIDSSGSNNNTINGTGNPCPLGFTHSIHNALVFATFCNATVFDVEYSSINGTVTRFNTTMSNSSVATIVSTTQQFTRIGNNQLLQSASLASLDNSGQDFLPTLATTYSQVALGAGSGAMVNSPAVEAQTRISKIVARVPKAPLFCLIVANLSLVVLGIILTIYALVASDDNSGEVQARLSVEGLVADRLDSIKSPVSSIEQLFSEKVRGDASKMVFMRTAEGGYTYGLWQGREDEHLTSKPS